ncbi:hypothetical protein M8A51_18280 [Schlegelella sp. S2-27]|uniref:Uncharacterized protein n=1 Tax=Caldimonas mangrovi TaxID=2944811 RepID=A0ABT0YST7_9BURK|nr:hypothetical protein [Caldimonas mangrovi]MCM5681479.1 hypothetical protein [Caldimonas mangrovi]
MENTLNPEAATAAGSLVHDRSTPHAFRWSVSRPLSVDPQHWHQVMLHACCHAWIGGLQSFSIGRDTASLCMREADGWRDAQGRPAELAQALSWIDAALKR